MIGSGNGVQIPIPGGRERFGLVAIDHLVIASLDHQEGPMASTRPAKSKASAIRSELISQMVGVCGTLRRNFVTVS